MSLRARLTAALVVVVTVPLLIAVALVARALPDASAARTQARVADARTVAVSKLAGACQRAVTAAVLLARNQGTPAQGAREAVGVGGVDAAILLGPTGVVRGTAVAGDAVESALVPLLRRAPDCRSGGGAVGGPLLVAARVGLTDTKGVPQGTAVAAVALDPALAPSAAPRLLASLVAGTPTDVTLLAAGGDGTRTPMGSTLPSAAADRLARHVSRLSAVSIDQGVRSTGGRAVTAVPLSGGAQLVVSAPLPDPTTLLIILSILAAVALLLALLVAYQLARVATRPLADLAGAAARVTAGDLETRLPGGRTGEVGALAESFNIMTDTLRQTINDLTGSRDELQRNVVRLGDALSGTHDLDRILAVIVETAMASVQATGGALLMTAANGDDLFLSVGRGLQGRLSADGERPEGRLVGARWSPADDPDAAQPPGVSSRVASTGEPLRGEVGADGLRLAPDEPKGRYVLAVPLRSDGRVTGVLDLYDRADGEPFDARDLDTVRSFMAQATVAIDNVMLHQEAQRLSITDGLTGLWNYRYVALALAREIERANRFERPLAVLMLDLDRFKRVNDRWGHQRGDAVLIEVAARIRSVVREVDVVARYGGEELLLVLPETDVEGAELLAARIRDTVNGRPVGEPDEEPVHVTTSIGIAVYPRDGESTRNLLRAADSALYAAKAAGRDTWRVAGAGPDPFLGPPEAPAAVPEQPTGGSARAGLADPRGC